MSQLSFKIIVLGLLLGFMNNLWALNQKIIDVYALNQDSQTNGIGESIGTIAFEDTSSGLAMVIKLKGLKPGEHGMHIHQNPSCEAQLKEGVLIPGLAAGGHLDPKQTEKHSGPFGEGHLGDLPRITADESGTVDQVVIVPRLTIYLTQNHAIVIHDGGDNYSDEPLPLGGGGPRVACGVIK